MKTNSTLKEIYDSCVQASDGRVLERDIRTLLCENNGIDNLSNLYTHLFENIKDLQRFQSDFARLLNQEPVEYITGKAIFLNRIFSVDKNVLIPRVETEEVVVFAEKKIREKFGDKKPVVIDVCTGSGCIAISLSLDLKINIIASDISYEALSVAKDNSNNLHSNVDFYQGDMLAPFLENHTKCDVILSNPPYVKKDAILDRSVRDYEPSLALFAKDGTEFYESILRNCSYILNKDGIIIFEIDPSLVDDLSKLINTYLPGAKFEFIEDINKNKRILYIKMI